LVGVEVVDDLMEGWCIDLVHWMHFDGRSGCERCVFYT